MKRLYGLLFFAAWLLFLSSCTPSYHGYGVLLWRDSTQEFKNGDILKLLSTSKLNEAFEVLSKDKKTKLMVPWWRVEYFKTSKEALKYAELYLPYAEMYVYSPKEGIPPVREKIGNEDTNKIVFKFKENQIAKVLNRSAEKVKVGNLDGYWYYVLLQNDVPMGAGKYTTVGIKGYCFGYHLRDINSDSSTDVNDASLVDARSGSLLDKFFDGNWKPISFQDMLDSGRIILSKFNPEWGIFPDIENNKIVIILENGPFTAEYREILQVNANVFTFPDSSLKIEMLSPNRLSATFIIKTGQVNINFANIKVDMEQVIENEHKRTDEIYDQFFTRGPVLASSAYGSIELMDGKRFSWKNLNKLIPSIIPRMVSGQGAITFNYFLSDVLVGKYDGVITFKFDDYAPDAGVNFLYQFADNGVKLNFIDNAAISDFEVKREGSNQIVIFFNFSGV